MSTNDMQEKTEKEKPRPAFVVSLCAMIVALGTVIMLTSGIVPVMTYSSPYLAAAILVPILVEFGRKQAWMTWFATAVLSMLTCADKEAAFFYVFFGNYPVVKQYLDRIGPKWIRMLVKFIYLAGDLAIMYGLLLFVLKMDLDFPGRGVTCALLFGLLLVVVLMLDRGVSAMEILYCRRLRQKLRFLK